MRLLLLCYALSGLFSLGYQVVWLRIFVDRFGSGTFTFALVISCFVGGLGAGALASKPVCDRARRLLGTGDDLTLYGAFELAIAVAALLIYAQALIPIDLLGHFPYVLQDGIFEPTLGFQMLKVPLAAASVLVPCFFMGITFPLLCSVFPERPRLPSSLYALNTFGACAAVLLGEFILIRHLGHDVTLGLLIVGNLGLGLFFVLRGASLLASWRARPAARAGELERDADSRASLQLTPGVMLIGACVSGLLSGLLEADGFRRVHFIQIYNGAAMSFVSFWAILAIFLASWTVHRLRFLRFAHVKIGFVLGLLLHVGIVRYAMYPVVRGLLQRADGQTADPDGSGAHLWAMFGVTGVVIFLPYYCVSLLLPFLCDAGQRRGMHLGRVYGLNTAAFLTGMIAFSWLAPMVNMFYAFKLGTLVFLILVGLLLFLPQGRGPRALPLAAALVATVAAVVLTPAHFDKDYLPQGDQLRSAQIRAFKGSASWSTFVARFPEGDAVYLDTGRMSATNASTSKYMKFMAHMPLLALEDPKRVLLICFGVGNTGSAIVRHSSLEEIDIVDLSRNILETAPEFALQNDLSFLDPRVRRIHDDGRSFLNVTDRRYDLVTSEPPPPLMDGICRLYSLEYYESILAHLTPAGCMTQWLPIYQMPPAAGRLIVRTFVRAFPYALLATGFGREFILVGSKRPIDLATLSRRFGEEPMVAGDLSSIGMPSPRHLIARIVMTDEQLDRAYGTGSVISDKSNLLSQYWPTTSILPFAYSPLAIQDILPTELRTELGPVFSDLREIVRLVPDFPISSLKLVTDDVAGVDVDWDLLARMRLDGPQRIRSGAWREGVGLFSACLVLVPEQVERYVECGSELAIAGHLSEAIQWFEEGARVCPEYEAIHLNLGRAYAQTRQFERALESARTAANLNPGSFEIRMLLADLFVRTSQRRAAIRNYRLAQKAKPASPLPRRGLAQLR